MFRGVRGGGRGRGRGGHGGGNVSAAKLMGLFQDGSWQCNCRPRLPANNFQTKKKGNNHGRWFYTCPKPKGQQCDFFLWEDDAKPREESAVLSNSRNEPRPANEPTTPPPPPYTAAAESSRTRNNRANFATESEEEDGFPWPLTGEEEAHMVRQADSISPPNITPRKSTVTNMLATPSTSRKRSVSFVDDVEYPELPTPNTTRRLGGRLGGETPQSGAYTRTIAGPSGFHTPQTTPTPSRFKDAISDIESGLDLAADVLDVLQQHKVSLDDDARSSLEQLLDRRSRRVQGIVRGRDVIRLQIAAKDARITEQQLRISTLEAELEAERAVVQHLKWQRQNGTESD